MTTTTTVHNAAAAIELLSGLTYFDRVALVAHLDGDTIDLHPGLDAIVRDQARSVVVAVTEVQPDTAFEVTVVAKH